MYFSPCSSSYQYTTCIKHSYSTNSSNQNNVYFGYIVLICCFITVFILVLEGQITRCAPLVPRGEDLSIKSPTCFSDHLYYVLTCICDLNFYFLHGAFHINKYFYLATTCLMSKKRKSVDQRKTFISENSLLQIIGLFKCNHTTQSSLLKLEISAIMK